MVELQVVLDIIVLDVECQDLVEDIAINVANLYQKPTIIIVQMRILIVLHAEALEDLIETVHMDTAVHTVIVVTIATHHLHHTAIVATDIHLNMDNRIWNITENGL